MEPRDSLAIRQADAADVAAYAALARAFEDYLTAIDPTAEGPPRVDHAAAFLRDACGPEPWFRCLLAEDAKGAQGYLSYVFGYWPEREAGSLFVTELYVREQARGRGVGRRLLAEAAAILRARGGTLLMWTVWRENRAAMRFYESIGAAYMDEERLMAWPASRWPDPAARGAADHRAGSET